MQYVLLPLDFFIYFRYRCFFDREGDTCSVRSLGRNESSTDLLGTIGRASSAAWRRQRLLNIGANQPQSPGADTENYNEQTSLADTASHIQSYGTLPSPRIHRTSHRDRKGIALPDINTSLSHSVPPTPVRTPATHEHTSGIRFRRTKTISTYDPPLTALYHSDNLRDIPDTKWNGIRVWYSSFSSVDWLHDAIKESSRLWQLRSRRSLRGRVRSALDRSVDWVTVTIVGFLTALIAFFIVRSEQWLFDLKEGRCLDAWWYAKRFCKNWQTWTEALGQTNDNSNGWLLGNSWWGIVEFTVYATAAVSLS